MIVKMRFAYRYSIALYIAQIVLSNMVDATI
jgi:hypothetical protein